MRALAVVVLVLAAAPAHADRAKAEQYFRAGAQAFKQQNFGAAAEQFELAYQELPLPEIAFSAAQAYRRQYFIDPQPRYVQRAVALYTKYLAAVKTGGRVGDAADGLAEMRRELDRLSAQGTRFDAAQKPQTRLAVSVTVAGEAHASLGDLSATPVTDTTGVHATLDGKPVELFVPLEVAPGDHIVEVRAPGFFPIRIARRAVEGASDVVEAALRPEPAHLTVHTDDGASIAIDGKPAGTAPLAAQALPAGRHTISITRRGREPVVRELQLGRDQALALDAPLAKTGKRRALPWLLGGTGVLVAGSAVTAVLALSADDQLGKLERERTTTGLTAAQFHALQDDQSKRDRYRDAALALGGAALAAGAVAAAFYWFDSPQPERALVPAITGDGAGITVVGRF